MLKIVRIGTPQAAKQQLRIVYITRAAGHLNQQLKAQPQVQGTMMMGMMPPASACFPGACRLRSPSP